MKFTIQVSNPRSLNRFDEEDENLGEAIETIYPLYTEELIMVWNHFYIPLSFKYDLSVMIKDILEMLGSLQKNEKGSLHICWPSNTFSAIWDLQWNPSGLEISSKWHSTLGGLEKLLNENNKILMKKDKFLSEWKKLLEVLKYSLLNAGYTKNKISSFQQLIEIESNILSYGELYSERSFRQNIVE